MRYGGRGAIFRGGIGDDAATPAPTPVPMATDSTILQRLDDRTKSIVAMIDEQNKNRKIALMIAAASALFAAVKFGIVAFPHIRSRVGRGS
jgi:hypothetical protein